MSIEWLDLIIFLFSLPGPLFFYTAEQTSCLISFKVMLHGAICRDDF